MKLAAPAHRLFYYMAGPAQALTGVSYLKMLLRDIG